MKRCLILLASLVLVLYLGGPAYAQGKRGVGGPSSTHGAPSNRPSDVGKSSSNSPSGHSATDLLTSNHKLDGALTNALTKNGALPKLPDGSTPNLVSDCSGFSNLGRCISAIHVAKNRDINFFCLREELTGQPLPTTGGTITCPANTEPNGAKSLGAAIHALDPNANAKAEAKKANKEADTEIKHASSS